MVEISERMKNIDASFSKFFSPGSGSIDLSVGIPGFDTPEHIKEAAYESMKRGSVGYVSPQGNPELRELIAEMYKESYGVDCGPDNVIITYGGKGAIFALMQCVVNRGDSVLIQDPGWLSYSEITKMAGGSPISVKADNEREFIDGIGSQANGKSKIAVFSSSANPTGDLYNGRMLKNLWDMANEHDFLAVSDEPYHEIVFDGKQHRSIGRYGLDNTVIINSFSKTYCMSGWRIGYAIAEKKLIDTMVKFQLHQSTCVPPFVQEAAKQALLHDHKGVEERKKIYERRRNLFLKLTGKHLNGNSPEGTFYYFPSVEKFGMNGHEFSRKLAEKGVIGVPGHLFGEYGKNNIRFTFTKSEHELRGASEIINEFIEDLN